jgi:hypothetical protein
MAFRLYISNFLYVLSLPIPNPTWLILAYFFLPTIEVKFFSTISTIQEFLTISLVSQLVLCIIVFPAAAIATRIRAKRYVDIKFRKWDHWMLLSLFIILVFNTSAVGYSFSQLTKSDITAGADFDLFITSVKQGLWFPPLQIMYQLKMFGQQRFLLEPYLPALFDICDGVNMTSKLNPLTYSPLVIAMICLAVILFFVPSFLEIDRLRFPKLTNGSVFSERKVMLAQFVFLWLFLAARMVLFLCYLAPADLLFTAKTIARLYYMYLPKLQRSNTPFINSGNLSIV